MLFEVDIRTPRQHKLQKLASFRAFTSKCAKKQGLAIADQRSLHHGIMQSQKR